MVQLKEIQLQGKTITIRADLNVPMEHGLITNERRIQAIIPTLSYALEAGAKIILLSHLGRPPAIVGNSATSQQHLYSLKPVAERLSHYLNQSLPLCKNWLENGVINRLLETNPIVLCENVRFQLGDRENDPLLAQRIADLSPIFVMDAFAVAHRSEASTVGAIHRAAMVIAGPLFCAELTALEKIATNPQRPLVAVMGGAKISDKLAILNYLLDRVDTLIVGGGLANTLLVAHGCEIGASLFEADQVSFARILLEKSKARGVDLILPQEVVVTSDRSELSSIRTIPVEAVLPHEKIFDIGPQSCEHIAQILKKAGTIVWNGPMGLFECDSFAEGTQYVAKAIAASDAFSIAGGGETLAAIDRFQLATGFNHLSTGGAAFLAYLSGQPLAAIQAIEARNSLKVEIIASIVERVTFASHQNDVAIIVDLSLKNLQDTAFENLELKLECEPALISVKTWKIDRLAATGEVRIPDKIRSLSLSGDQLMNLNERMRVELKLTLYKEAEILSQKHHQIIALAKNEWGGARYMPELLAAFVMPNDPAISILLSQAGNVLRSAGKQPALNGYQSKSRTYVWEMAAAIWQAISSRRLVYVIPPASFESEGQKIRTPTEVIDTGLATCLDSTVLFAAALEQAGLHTILAFTKGHALCGVWLQPQQLRTLTTDDCSELRKCVAAKELVLFETTLVVQEPPVSFSKAIKEGNRQISEDEEQNFVYALDIKRARGQQITPLATVIQTIEKAHTSDSSNFVLEQGLETAPELPGFDLEQNAPLLLETPETRLEHWKRKLLDLTKRNRLLNLRSSKTAGLLYCSDVAALEDKLAQGKEIIVIPIATLSGQKNERDNSLFIDRTGDDFSKKFIEEAFERDEIVSELPQFELRAQMVALYRKAKSDLEEGGANTLYLALGLLKWTPLENATQSYKAPLMLVPVKLERKSAASPVRLVRHEDEPVFNMTLLEMLRQDFDLRLPGLEGTLPKDQFGVDLVRVFELVRKAVRDIPGFELVEEIVLSTFSFAKYLMWKDLADRAETLKQNSFVNHLIDKYREPYEYSTTVLKPDQIDEKINPSELFMPLLADSSQVIAVHASAQEGDFILKGPPGTGKSQTIANMIAHNLALGRKVLFVCEKMAALEVVYRRLCEKGLEHFCLELHSNKAGKSHVLNQLRQSWYSRGAHSQAAWHQEAESLKKYRDELNALVKALHTPGITGISPHAAIGRAVRWQDIHRFRLDWSGGLEADQAKDKVGLARLEDMAKRLGQRYGLLNDEHKSAFADICKADWSHAWQERLIHAAQDLVRCIHQLQETAGIFSAAAHLPDSESNLARLRGLTLIAKFLPVIATNSLEFGLGANYKAVLSSFEGALECLALYHAGKENLSCDYPDHSILSMSIEHWKSDWTRAAGLFQPLDIIQHWRLAIRLRKTLVLTAVPKLEQDLPILEKLQSIRQQMEGLASELPPSTGWKALDTDLQKAKESLHAAKSLREGIVRLAKTPAELAELCALLKELCINGQELLQVGMPLADNAEALVGDMNAFEASLKNFLHEACTNDSSINDIRILQVQAESIIKLQSKINSWCLWRAACSEAESLEIKTFIAALENGIVEPSMAEDAFKTAYCIWLAKRLVDSRPELRTFVTLEHEEKIAAFGRLDQKISDLSIDYIRSKLSENIPNPDVQDRPPAYSMLSREIQKRTRQKPVRQVVSEMGDALTALTPCLLMSPLSVSQFLSAHDQLFDLVIFDEASQITVWDAIGAIARGKNVIIVGDPKQMPPTRFFDRADFDEDDEHSFEDLESILDEALAAGMKVHSLTGHYRSRHESLIAFSNHRYYGGNLVTYPSVETKQSAVSFVKIDGLYQRGRGRTNPDEAKAVVREIVRRLNDPKYNTHSIGVIALNSEQQRLIDDLLDQERRNNPDLEKFFNDNVEEPLFVKNLETVQGDQRDVILLSIGYGPHTPGAATMSMHFGPLNRKGGERRLNVAITRATSEVVIFASFDPSMIDLTRTSATAVRDLKHYLEFAQRGPSALGEAILREGIDEFDSDFEEAVAEGLRKKGWNIHTQIGVSKFRIDLGIVDPDYPGRYLAGVECDGATYHSAPSVRDRDRVRQCILEKLGWKLLRIWSTDFWIDPASVLNLTHERLSNLLEERRQTDPATHLNRGNNQEHQMPETLSDIGDVLAKKLTISGL